MKENILITSLARVTPHAPWRVGIYIDGGYTFVTVGEKGNVAASPRFQMFISEVEKKTSRYPVNVTFHALVDDREMEVSMIRDQIVYIDCNATSNRLARKASYYYDKEVKGNPLQVRRVAPQPAEGGFTTFAVEENIASTTLDYIGVGEVTNVVDGDTIEVKILHLQDFMHKHMEIDQEITIRLNGADTAERKESNGSLNAFKEQKNTEFGKTWALKKEDMYAIAEEATEFTKKTLGVSGSSKPLVIINFERVKDGEEPSRDSEEYSYYVADIYATQEKTAEIAIEKVKKGNSFVHVNKTLLTTNSSKHKHVPLGFMDNNTAGNNTMLNPYDWLMELDIKVVTQGQTYETPEVEAEDEGSETTNPEGAFEEQLDTNTLNFGPSVQPSSNTLNFFKPYDDRISTFTKGIETPEDLKTHSRVRIGDVILTIPPIAIQVTKTSNISKVKTMRTKSSVLVNRGQTLTTLTMDLYFNDLDSINGKKHGWKGKDDKDNFFKVDGLRPLLAQFAKAPFVPIDNYYINATLGIHDVALMDIEVTTVPNFPDSLSARLTLIEFNSEAYFLDKACLADAINYPMLRWFYNQALDSSRDAKYRYFKELDAPVTSDIKFQLADEGYLNLRKDAISFLKNADSPEAVRVELKENNPAYATKTTDQKKVKKILQRHTNYVDVGIKKYTLIDSLVKPGKNFASNKMVEALMETYDIKRETAENAVTESKELLVRIYDVGNKDDERPLSLEDNFIPYESDYYYRVRFKEEQLENWWGQDYFKTEPPVDYENELYKGKEKSGLFFVSKMEDNDNQAKMEEHFSEYLKDDQFILPGTDSVIKILKEIAESAKALLATVDDYADQFNAMVRIVDGSEQTVTMNDYEIPGGIIPISLNVRYANEFSMAHVQSGEAVTLQYMGGGDTTADIVLEVGEEGAAAFSELIGASDRYAKIYNQGITNGFIGLQNDLTALFGIDYVMFESISINTVSGYPGRYQIMLKAICFDKTQRQREELVGIPGNSKHMDAEMLEANKNAFASDRMIEARLSKLEVYPDMELPTYGQINAALPLMDTGGCEEYLNPLGGTYVDPDFYVSTSATFRQMVEDQYGQDHRLNMFDSTGVKAHTSNSNKDKLFDTTEEDWAMLNALQEDEESKPLGWLFQWDAKEEDENTVEVDTSGSGQALSEQAGDAKVSNADTQAFLDEEKDGERAYKKFPSKEEWTRLFGDTYDYDKFSKAPEGNQTEIYRKLSGLVDTYFSEFYSKKDFLKDCKGNLDDADDSAKKVSYGLPDHMYAAAQSVRYGQLKSGSELKAVENYSKDNDLGEANREMEFEKGTKITVEPKHLRKTDKKITKERFMTLMKAFLDSSSKWSHFKDGGALVSGLGRAGLGQVDISATELSTDEAKKLIYNWEYNLTEAVKQLAGHFKKANKLKEDGSNFQIRCRAWDAMFAMYDNPSKELTTSKEVWASGLANSVMTNFVKYATKPFNTAAGFDMALYREYAGLSEDDTKAMGDMDEKEFVDELMELEYYDLAVLKSEGLTVDSEIENISRVMKPHLEEMSVDTLKQVYEKHIKMLYELGKSGWTNKITSAGEAIAGILPESWVKAGEKTGTYVTNDYVKDRKDANDYEFSKEIQEKGIAAYETLLMVGKVATDSLGSTDTRLYNDVDPRTLYEEMFYDLRYHDQRGRLIRAFPGFQMFIIHEGDYFGKYKFWDNMYGFNAIESIDVHRSRKIAADTAVISMSNVYSNLTTRRTDIDYVDRQMKWWDNYVWNELPEDLIDKKANETHKNIFLETGARIHLRMGYSATASSLPIVFNGTITELSAGDVIDIVAQGDGVELGNPISGDPEDDNDGLYNVTEPRDLICGLLSSKGSWTKDFLNAVSEKRLFKRNPLGIMHFGQPFNTDENAAAKPLGNLLWFNDEYGEVAQNIYSSNGTPTFSQWLHPNGERNNIFEDFSFTRLWENKFKIFNPGDEKNLVMKLYNNTTWDIVQTVALSSPDYIAAIHPFELRSTLFFGKPWWRASFEYNSKYEFDAVNKTWARHLIGEARRPYMQHKFYTSHHDIIANNIKVSEETMFTNVIVNYDGKQTPVLFADADIRFDKQKTRVIEGNILAKFGDFYTSEVMASFYGNSVLRDAMKDMYQGSLVVMGDPTVKPHDMMSILDEINDINGNALVKSVTHHFSLDTGFITSIEPDLLVANDDPMLLEMSKWFYSFASSVGATLAIRHAGKKVMRNVVSWIGKDDTLPKNVGKWAATKGFRKSMSMVADGSEDMNKVMKTLDDIIDGDGKDVAALRQQLTEQLKVADDNMAKSTGKMASVKNASRKAAIKSGRSFAALLNSSDDIASITMKSGKILRAVGGFTPVGFLLNTAIWIGTEMIFEHYRRYKENLQCVIALPLSYRGKEWVAGINGHAGMIYGDAPGKYDRMFDATLFHDDGEDEFFGNAFIEIANFMTGTGGQYEKVDTKEAEENTLYNHYF